MRLNRRVLCFTNGPGDPSENGELISNIRKLAGRLPIFGICLGHQLFALAMGGRTKKMKYGHRGSNQPVKNLDTGRVYISSQNHGYEVISSSVEGGKLSFVNANDGTCEGFEYPDLNAYTVQFHPEACGGPDGTARSCSTSSYSTSRRADTMPKREDIKKVLVIGSGPIVIGQAAEFDYAGAQACACSKTPDSTWCSATPTPRP